eukprot:TRINITY_DN1775_c0_g1_i1.p1 TRINITY_DN1775_c0_g1~~TRINITY_DN1775_c0_g1_i1.p1  ORF type:complete len:1676 (+),score=349.77 TRINITY_DN1775_c0_g1_i1:35-5029(+)
MDSKKLSALKGGNVNKIIDVVDILSRTMIQGEFDYEDIHDADEKEKLFVDIIQDLYDICKRHGNHKLNLRIGNLLGRILTSDQMVLTPEHISTCLKSLIHVYLNLRNSVEYESMKVLFILSVSNIFRRLPWVTKEDQQYDILYRQAEFVLSLLYDLSLSGLPRDENGLPDFSTRLSLEAFCLRELALSSFKDLVQANYQTFFLVPELLEVLKGSLMFILFMNLFTHEEKLTELCCGIFDDCMTNLRAPLHKELGIILTHFFIPLSINVLLPVNSRKILLSQINKLFENPVVFMDIFFNFDACVGQENLLEIIIDAYLKIIELEDGPNYEPIIRQLSLQGIFACLKAMRYWNENGGTRVLAYEEKLQNIGIRTVVSDNGENLYSEKKKLNGNFEALIMFNKGKGMDAVNLLVQTGSLDLSKEDIHNFLFNQKKLGIEELENLCERVATAMYEWISTRIGILSKTVIGELIGKFKPFNEALLRVFTDAQDFTEMKVMDAFRKFTLTFKMPQEGPQVDKICFVFADKYKRDHQLAMSSECLHGVIYWTLMANASLHNPTVKTKATTEFFKEGYYSQADEDERIWVSEEFLEEIFEDISREAFAVLDDDIHVSKQLYNQQNESGLDFEIFYREMTTFQHRGIDGFLQYRSDVSGYVGSLLYELFLKGRTNLVTLKNISTEGQWIIPVDKSLVTIPVARLLSKCTGAVLNVISDEPLNTNVTNALLSTNDLFMLCYSFGKVKVAERIFATLSETSKLRIGDLPSVFTHRNVVIIQNLLKFSCDFAVYLSHDSWTKVLVVISELERLLPFAGIGAHSEPLTEVQRTENRIAALIAEFIKESSYQKVFAVGLTLPIHSALQLASAIAFISREELAEQDRQQKKARNNQIKPRLFLLQSLVEMFHHILDHLKNDEQNEILELWKIVSQHFSEVALSKDVTTSLLSVSNLKIVVRSVLDHTDKSFLDNLLFDPFVYIVERSKESLTVGQILDLLHELTQFYAENFGKSWKTMFDVCASCVHAEQEVAEQAFGLLESFVENETVLKSIAKSNVDFESLTAAIAIFCPVPIELMRRRSLELLTKLFFAGRNLKDETNKVEDDISLVNDNNETSVDPTFDIGPGMSSVGMSNDNIGPSFDCVFGAAPGMSSVSMNDDDVEPCIGPSVGGMSGVFGCGSESLSPYKQKSISKTAFERITLAVFGEMCGLLKNNALDNPSRVCVLSRAEQIVSEHGTEFTENIWTPLLVSLLEIFDIYKEQEFSAIDGEMFGDFFNFIIDTMKLHSEPIFDIIYEIFEIFETIAKQHQSTALLSSSLEYLAKLIPIVFEVYPEEHDTLCNIIGTTLSRILSVSFPTQLVEATLPPPNEPIPLVTNNDEKVEKQTTKFEIDFDDPNMDPRLISQQMGLTGISSGNIAPSKVSSAFEMNLEEQYEPLDINKIVHQMHCIGLIMDFVYKILVNTSYSSDGNSEHAIIVGVPSPSKLFEQLSLQILQRIFSTLQKIHKQCVKFNNNMQRRERLMELGEMLLIQPTSPGSHALPSLNNQEVLAARISIIGYYLCCERKELNEMEQEITYFTYTNLISDCLKHFLSSKKRYTTSSSNRRLSMIRSENYAYHHTVQSIMKQIYEMDIDSELFKMVIQHNYEKLVRIAFNSFDVEHIEKIFLEKLPKLVNLKFEEF